MSRIPSAFAAGRVLLYLDYRQQEPGIVAALSGDQALQAAYQSGDLYTTFLVQAGLAPIGATAVSHRALRDQAKTCVLGLNYCMGADRMAFRLSCQPIYAEQLIRRHKATSPQFWRWIKAAVDSAFCTGQIVTRGNWPLYLTWMTRASTVQNFPAQGNGSEILRHACCLLTEAGLTVCAPVHDAVLIECSEADMDHTIWRAQRLMEQASRDVLGGFTLGTDVAKVVRYPDRYRDEQGVPIWRRICEEAEIDDRMAAFDGPPCKLLAG